MRKTLMYVVTLLVCLGLVGAVWAGKGGKKNKESNIPVTVTFRDLVAPDDLIRSDGDLTYTDGVDGVAATISAGPSHQGRLRFSTGKEMRKLTLNFDFPPTVDLKGAKCTDARFPSMDENCRTVANLITLNEWGDNGIGGFGELDHRLNLLTMPVGSTTFVGFQIIFPSELKRKTNRLRFGFFGGRPGTVKRTAVDTWTLEAVEPTDFTTDPPSQPILSDADLFEANTNSAKGGTFSKTGSGTLPFLITVKCIVARACCKTSANSL